MFRWKENTDAGLRKKPRRGWRRAGFALLAVVGLVLASTLLNLFLESRERATVQPYGERVAVAGGSLNVVRNGQQGQAIVLLSGLGTPAPGLDFQPLVRELNGFDVTVVEGFGYGYSDAEAGPRSNENISNELHQALAMLKVPRPYVLAGHSIAGFYLLDYANRYRSEVAAVVGIDATIPKPGTGPSRSRSRASTGPGPWPPPAWCGQWRRWPPPSWIRTAAPSPTTNSRVCA